MIKLEEKYHKSGHLGMKVRWTTDGRRKVDYCLPTCGGLPLELR